MVWGALLKMARGAAIFFAVASVLGFLMYLPHHDAIAMMYFLTTFAVLLVFAAYPRRLLAIGWFRGLLALLAILAIATTIPMMYRDFHLVNAPDYGALILRSLECAVFAVMALEPFLWARSSAASP